MSYNLHEVEQAKLSGELIFGCLPAGYPKQISYLGLGIIILALFPAADGGGEGGRERDGAAVTAVI